MRAQDLNCQETCENIMLKAHFSSKMNCSSNSIIWYIGKFYKDRQPSTFRVRYLTWTSFQPWEVCARPEMGFEHKTFGSQLTIINGSVTSFIQLSLSSMFPELNLDYMSSEADYPEALALYQVFKLPLICANEPLEADYYFSCTLW